MIKRITCLCLLMAFTLSGDLFAKQISAEKAADYAKVIFATYTQQPSLQSKSVSQLEIVSQFTKTYEGEEMYHIYNMAPTGFVIISAEDQYNAVLAFSDESNVDFSDDVKNAGFFGEMSRHEQRIEYTRNNNLMASEAIADEWQTLKAADSQFDYKTDAPQEGAIVGPLTTTKWNQGDYYNAFCPVADPADTLAPDGLTYAGCVALSFVQLLKYHEHPVNGNGSIQYTDPLYGPQTADFCGAAYNWDNMPDSLTDYNDDVAELVYHSAASIQSEFSTVYTAAYISYVRNSLVYFFGYDTSAVWQADPGPIFPVVAKNDLDLGRPVILTGSIGAAGHSWLCDGYGCFTTFGATEPADYFHFNWGWGGDNNGWYLDNGAAWEPLSDQPGTQIITYYYERWIVHNLFPAADGCSAPEYSRLGDAGINDTYAYLSYSALPLSDPEISFRYRQVGDTDWIETSTTFDYALYVSGLYPGTEYEFQARRKCCPDSWSEYSHSYKFTTTGEFCAALSTDQLGSNGIGETTAYISTAQPYGSVSNQFRYRVVGTTDWMLTTVDNSTNRLLDGLEASTQYEFQVKHECGNGDWTAWSESEFFETDGSHFEFHATILLEGPYVGGGTMGNSLNLNGLIPNEQPFSGAPYNYVGTENLQNDVPVNMVDWVLVEARTGTPSLTAPKATVTVEVHPAILMSDGSLFGVNKEPGVRFTNLVAGESYHFCIRHRNHLDVLSATPVTGGSFMSYNFASGADKAFGTNQVKAMNDGFFALFTGDYNQDGVIQTTDYDVWQSNPAINNTYSQADGNLDGVVQATDFDKWFPNKAKVGSVEIGF